MTNDATRADKEIAMSLDARPPVRVIAAAGDAVSTLGQNARVTSWIDTAENLLGFGRADAVEKSPAAIIRAEYRARHPVRDLP